MKGGPSVWNFGDPQLFVPYGNMDHDVAIGKIANDARVAIDTFHTGEIADIPFTVSTAPVADSFGQPQIKVDLLIDAARIGLTIRGYVATICG